MVNKRESVINPVKIDMPKMLKGMGQNGKWVVSGLLITKARTLLPPGDSRHLTFYLSPTRNTVSPYARPQGQADRKESCWGCG